MNYLDLIQLVDQASTWSEARTIVESHVELLSEACDALGQLAQQSPDPDDAERLSAIQVYFERCRSFGVAHATAEQIAAVRCSLVLEKQPIIQVSKRVAQGELMIGEALEEVSTVGVEAGESDVLLVEGYIRDILSDETLEQALLMASLANELAQRTAVLAQIRIALLLGELQRRKGAIADATTNLKRAELLTSATGDDLTKATIAGELAQCFVARGESGPAQEYFDQAARLTLRQEPSRAWWYLARLADTYEEAHDLERAIAVESRALEAARQAKAPQAQAYSLGDLGSLLGKVGRKQEAREALREAIERSHEAGDPADEAWRSYLLAEALWPDDKDQAFFWYRAAVNLVPFDADWLGASLYLAAFGRHLTAEAHYDEAREVYERAIAFSRQLKDEHEEAEFRIRLGSVLQHQNRLEESLQEYQAALTIRIAEGDLIAQADHLSKIADVEYQLDRVQEAIEHAAQALRFAEQIGDAKEPIYRLLDLSRFCSMGGDLAQAQAYADRAVEMASKQEDKGLILDVLAGAGRLMSSFGLMEKAIILLQQALTLSRKDNDRLHEIQVMQQMGRTLISMGLKEEAADVLRQGLQAAHAENQTLLELELMETLNMANDLGGLWEDVESVGNAALIRYRQNGDEDSVASCLSRLGNLYMSEDPKRAIGYFEELARLLESQRELHSLVLVLSSLGDSWRNLGNVEQALQCYERALNALSPDQSNQIRAFLLLYLANNHRYLGHYEESERYFDMASRLLGQSTSLNVFSEIAFMILSWRGDLYFEQGKWTEAVESYQSAIELLNRLYQIAATANVRAYWIDSGRPYYARLIQASLKTTADFGPMRDQRKRVAFDSAEAARSRLFIGQLGQTLLSAIPGPAEEWIERESKALAGLKALERENMDGFVQRIGRHTETQTAHFIDKRLEHWNELQDIWNHIALSGNAGREYVAIRKGEIVSWLELVHLLAER